jgi:hypothetical protein
MATIPSLAMIPSGYKASKLYSVLPTDGSGDLDVVRATTATRVNSSGLIESVASNVPRLDYTNGSCPSILVEPQRTNIALRSQEFENAYWDKFNTTITANNTTAPDGTNTADKFVETTANNFHSMDSTFTAGIGIHTATIFAKIGERRYLRLNITEITPAVDYTALFDLQTGTLLSNSSGVTANITSFIDGWYKISVTSPALVGGQVRMALLMQTTTSSTPQSYLGDGTSGIYIWGAQLEAGSYATSYIPTTSESVTRNADVISKTGISSLIGQTEGVVFVDYNYQQRSELQVIFSLQGATTASFLEIYNTTSNEIFFGIYNGGTIQASFTTAAQAAGRYKIAFAYKANDFAIYVNGVQAHTDNSGSVPSLSSLAIGSDIATGGFNLAQTINQTLLFKTRLTNAQLAELTTL